MAVEVASAYISLIPSFSGGAARISSELSGISQGAGKRAGSRFGKVFATSALPPFRAFGTAALGFFAADKLVDFFSSAIGGASDLSEATNKISTIFGNAAGSIDKFASAGAAGLGQSKLAALDAAATFGGYGKAAGLAGSENAKFATGLVGLSSDLASFRNTTPEQAIEAIGAALRGESEPIRAYGVLLDDATLRNEALRLGLIKSTKTALTPQQKVLAAHASILKQTTDAQGDFARTSGGLANQQRTLSAEWTNMKAQIGTGLLPAMTALTTFATSKLLPVLGKWSSTAQTVLGPALNKVAGIIQTVVLPAIRTFAQFAAPIITQVSAAFGALAASAGGFLRSLLPTLQAFGAQILAVLGPALRSIATILSTEVFPAIAGFLDAARPVAVWFLETLGPTVVNTLSGVIEVVKGALRIIGGMFNVATALLKGDWSKAWQGIRQIASGIWQAIKGAFTIFVTVGLVKVFRLGLGLMAKLGSLAWQGIRALFSRGIAAVRGAVSAGIDAVVGFFASLPGRAISALGGLAGRLIGTLVPAVNGAKTAVVEAGAKLLKWFSDLPGNIVRGVGELGGLLTGAGAKLVTGLWDGIKRVARKMINWFKENVVDRMRGLWPFSPAKWGPLRDHPMDEAGANLVRGLASGIAGEQDTLLSQMNKLATLVAESSPQAAGGKRWASKVRTLTPGPVAALPGGDSIVVNAHQVSLDEQGLARVLYAARLRARVERPR